MKNLIIILFSFLCAEGSAQKLHLLVNFDDGDRTGGNQLTYNIGLASDSGMVVVDTPSISGKALLSRCATNDSSTTFFPRQETKIRKVNADSIANDDFIGFDVYFPGWPLDSRQLLFMQGKTYDATFPQISLWPLRVGSKTYIQLVRQVDTISATKQLTNPTSTGQVIDTMTVMELPVYQWTRIDLKFNWSQRYTGQIDVYINRKLAITMHGANLNKTFSDILVKRPEFRIGGYLFGSKSSPTTPNVLVRNIVFDNVTIGRLNEMSWDEYISYFNVIGIPVPTFQVPFLPSRQ